MSESFLKPDAVQPVIETKPEDLSLEDKFKIVSKRVDDSQTYIKEQTKIIEMQAEALKRYEAIEERLKTIDLKATGDADVKDTTPSIDPEELLKKTDELLTKRLHEREVEAAKDSNWKAVTAELTDRFGDKVDEVVKKVAAENEISWEEALALAKHKPKIFLSMFPKADKQQPVRSTFGTVNSAAVNQSNKQTKLPELDARSLKSLMGYAEALKKHYGV